MHRRFEGVWISKKLWLSKQMTALEKCLLAEINSLDNKEHCFVSNSYLASMLGCSESKVSKTVSKFKQLGLIQQVRSDGRKRFLRVTAKGRSLLR